MRVLPLVAAFGLLVVGLAPLAAAQLPHPHEDLVHHPLTIQAEMEAIRDKNPGAIAMDSFGVSVAQFPLWYLDYVHPDVRAEPGALAATPVYYLDANHHGNEQLGMEALLIFMDELADWSLTDEGAARLAEVRVVAAPMINPDGTGTDKRVNTRGVDLNRNYDYNWGKYGTSDTMNPLTGNYRGDAPLSEPETSANAAFMSELRPDVYLSMHTGSHDIVLPWRQDPDADGPMPDWPVYEHWLGHIKNASGLDHRDPSGAGESISYAYGMMGTLSVIVEVDQLQTEVVVQDIPETLKEEVAIYWDTLHRFETLGGWLVAENGTLVNRGAGPAYNVTLHEGAPGGVSGAPGAAGQGLLPRGSSVHRPTAAAPGGPHTILAHRLAPGEMVSGSAGLVTYERRLQGDEGRPVWSVHLAGEADDSVEDDARAVPLPLVVALAALAWAVRRRPA